MRKIPIKTSDKKFYRQILELLHSVPPFTKLRKRELDVLGEIMRQNNKYNKTTIESRNLIVFSTKIRKEMRDSIGVSEDIFNNNMSSLKKHGIINKDNRLMPYLESMFFNEEFILQFIFKK